MVYLGIYSFNNPDKEAWYGTVKGIANLYKNKDAGTAASADELIDIH
jgi:hypothetical protein